MSRTAHRRLTVVREFMDVHSLPVVRNPLPEASDDVRRLPDADDPELGQGPVPGMHDDGLQAEQQLEEAPPLIKVNDPVELDVVPVPGRRRAAPR